MINPPGIHIALSKKKLKVDTVKILTTVTKTILKSLTGTETVPIAGTMKEAASLATMVNLESEPERIAYSILLNSLLHSAEALTSEHINTLSLSLRAAKKPSNTIAYQPLIEGITEMLTDNDLLIDDQFFKNPRSFLSTQLPEFGAMYHRCLEECGASPQEAINITRHLPSYFTFAVYDYVIKNYDQYQKLYNLLNHPVAEAARKEYEWAAYFAHLQKEVELPVFGETFSLKDLYVPLRAYYEKKEKKELGLAIEGAKDNTRKETHIISLTDNFNGWLNDTGGKNNLRMISGGPGSGKSSFAKMWAASLAENNRRLLFVPLHRIDYKSDIIDAINTYFTRRLLFSSDPIDNKGKNENAETMLIIFDGLDELIMGNETSRSAAQNFLSELRRLCFHQKNLRVLVTGRPIAVQNVETQLRGNEEQLIHLLPYYLQETLSGTVIDNRELLLIDQRNDWWNNFHKLKADTTSKGLPTELDNDNLHPITSEPLLNYLVALLWSKDADSFSQSTNLNEIYDRLINQVYDRDYEPNSDTHKQLPPDKFFLILQEIAVCAWHGGDVRVTSVNKIETHIKKKKQVSKYFDSYKDSAQAGLSKLLTAFYFKKFEGQNSTNDESFEFTHKSFGEYLTAKAIVTLSRSTQKNIAAHEKSKNEEINQGYDQEKALSKWMSIFSPTALDEDIIEFIKGELIILEKKEPGIAHKIQLTLISILKEAFYNKITLSNDARKTYKAETIQVSNLLNALIVMIGITASIAKELSVLGFSDEKLGILFHYLHTNFSVTPIGFKNLAYLDLSEANLMGGNLRNVNLSEANLSEANLGEANLWGANLWKAELWGASMVGTNLFGGDLRGANLSSADLWGANLSCADLAVANLVGTDLGGANLSEANLILANLKGADLRGANLSRANLSEANLSGANLSEASFWGANLSEANLMEAMVDSVYWLTYLEEKGVIGCKQIRQKYAVQDLGKILILVPRD